MSDPLVILGAGPRCGSTLMQRLVSSHPEAFIWGEYAGYLSEMLDAVERLVAHNEEYGWIGRAEFARLGHQGFIANLIPEPPVVTEAFGAFCARLFGAPGARVWGFKEIRYDLGFATRLHRFLPGMRVIFLVRDPRDVLCSLDEWERSGWWPRVRTWKVVLDWMQIAGSFLETTSIPVLSLRYEDFCADPAGTAQRVGDFAGLDPAGFDLSVFDHKVYNLGAEGDRTLRRWDELPAELHTLLANDAFRATAKAHDYLLDDDL